MGPGSDHLDVGSVDRARDKNWMEKFRTWYASEKPVPIKPKARGFADRWPTLEGCSRRVGVDR